MSNSTTTKTESRSGFKKTKLGWIPEDWNNSTIGSYIQFTGGSQPPRSTFIFEEKKGYSRLIQTRDYRTDKYKTYIKSDSTSKFCDEDDIMIGRYGPPIFQIFRGLKGAYNVALIKADPKTEGLHKNYMWYFLNRRDLRAYLESLSQRSGGQTGVEMDLLKSYDFPVPPLPEQKAIANCLSTWDTAITKLDSLIKAKQQLKKALMQQLLSGATRLPGFDGEWEEKRLSELFEEIKDKNDGGKHEPLSISAGKGFRSQREKFDRVIAGTSLSKYIQLKKGDFSYNKGNSKSYKMGCIYLLESYKTALVPFVFISFRPTEKVVSHFYKHFFIDHGLDRQLKRIITSGARGDGLLNVSKKDFFKLIVPFPQKEEQTAIAQVLNTADQEIELLTNQRNQLQLQKKGLMQQLLTGKKRLRTNG